MADVTTTQAGGAQPTQDHNVAPGTPGTIPATSSQQPAQSTPALPQENAVMQQARARNEAMLAAQNGGILNTQAGKTTIGDLYAQGVRDKNAIGSFQNNGDQGTGGTSMTETGTGTTAKPENIQNPMPLGQQQAIDLQKQQQATQVQQTQQAQAQYNSQPVSQGQRDADMIFASEIRTAANEFGNKLDAFTGSFKNDMGEFLNNQTNSYSALVDQMSQFMQAQTGEIKALSDKQIATWDNLSKTFDVEKNAAIAETNQNAKTLTDFARLDEQMALKQNQLAQAQTAAQYADQIAVAQENQSRYLGFLAGKFDAAGMANSSAGVQLLGKYLAAGQAQINSLQRDADTAQQMYIAKGTDIINSFAKQAFQIEAQRQQDTRKLRQDANDRIMQIESNKFATEEKKLMDIYSITKDYNSMVMDAKSKAFSEIMQVKDQHLKEAQFAQTVIQDTIKNQQWEQSFKQGVFESDRTYGLQERQENRALDSQRTSETGNLWINGQDTGQRALPGLTYDKQIEQWNKTFRQGQYEFEKNYDLNSAQFDLQRQRFASEEDQKKFERSITIAQNNLANNPSFAKYLSPEDIIGMGAYVSQKDGAVTSMGERVASALNTAAQNVDKGFQCVQFARKIVPDLPSGLYSLADKIKTLTKGTHSIDAPTPGAVVVLDWKTPQERGKSADEYAGHVAVVKSVDEQNGTFTIVDYNGSGGSYKVGEKTIKMNNPAVKGYWMSPNVQSGGGKIGNSDLQNQFNLVSTNLPKDARINAQEQLSNYVKNKDIEGANKYINQIAISHLSGEDKNKYASFSDTGAETDRFLNLYKNVDVKGGPWQKLANDNRKWGELAQDKQYLEFYGDALRSMADFKHTLAGSNVTPSELQNAQAFLVTPDDTVKDVLVKIQGMNRFSKDTAQRILNRAKGVDVSNTSALGDLLSKYGL